MDANINPMWIPIAGMIVSTVMLIGVVAIVFWYKARSRELQFHQDLRIREMEHQRKMKEMELEMERIKARSLPEHAA